MGDRDQDGDRDQVVRFRTGFGMLHGAGNALVQPLVFVHVFEYGGCVSIAQLESPAAGRVLPAGIVAGRTRIVHAVLDAVLVRIADETTVVSSADLAEIDRIAARVQGVRLALIGKADRAQVHRQAGHANTAAWVADTTRAGGGAAHREVVLAAALGQDLPVTAAALSAGEVSGVNAGIVAATMAALPDGLTQDERARVEQVLVADAARMDPARLRKAALVAVAAAGRSAQQVAAHQEDILLGQERAAYQRAHFTMHDHGDGCTSGRFLIPTGPAHILRKVLHTMTPPRHHPPDQAEQATQTTQATDHGTGSSTGSGRATDWANLDWAQRRGRAFTDLLEHLDTQRLPGPVAATIVLTLTLDQALPHTTNSSGSTDSTDSSDDSRSGSTSENSGENSGEATTTTRALRAALETTLGHPIRHTPTTGAVPTDTGHHHSTHDSQRLTCNAGLVRLLLDHHTVPLNLGRTHRLYTPNQRLALATRYDTCATHGCDRPYAWRDLHHQHPWTTGGHTNLHHAIPLCGQHHRHIHDPHYHHTITTTQEGIKTVHFHLHPPRE